MSVGRDSPPAIAAAELFMQAIIVRRPDLQAVEVRGTLGIRAYAISLGIMLFALSGPVQGAIARRKKNASP
jgi:hypothetical protein